VNLEEMFEATNDDYLDFDKVENPLSKRADLHAFMLLDKLVPDSGDLISASEHDEFYLSVDCEALAKVATLDIVRDLSRCGVRFSSEYDCLCMFA
jgi:hypothetical protein